MKHVVKHSVQFAKLRNLAIMASFVLAGCAAPTVTTINVPIPVECRETVPERPAMPTEEFKAKPTLDEFTQAAQAEIERREGYEKRLNSALVACTTPINPE